MAADSRVQIHLECPENAVFPRRFEPVRLGVPLARGGMAGPAVLVRSERGDPLPTQSRVLERWPDGTPRWLLVDFMASVDAGQTAIYTLESTAEGGVPQPTAIVTIEPRGSGVVVNTGVALFEMQAGTPFPFAAVPSTGELAGKAVRGTLLVDANGGVGNTTTSSVTVEEAGSLRCVVRCEGRVDLEGIADLEIVARLHFFAGSSVVRLEITLCNPHAAQHPGGIWELGEPAAMLLRDVSFTLAPSASGAALSCSPQVGAALESCGESLELFQASSGGEQWNIRTHVNRHGQVPMAFRGFRLTDAQGARTGDRATPIVALGSGAGLALTMPQFWQQFPKAIEGSGDGLTLRLFPRQHGDDHELQPGEQKTHVFFAAVAGDAISGVPLAWARSPLFACTTPEQYAAAAAMPYLLPLADEPHPAYGNLVGLALDGPDSFQRKREAIDEYGWRNYGDVYADHESAYYRGPAPIISHYNNQYDAIAGLACQFMRSGDRRWWDQMDDLAAHVVDIDIYHTDQDKAGYNRGLFWHTSHYVDAGKSSHRSFPRDPDVHGGGPSPEHNYATGLLLHYFLTGTERSREAAIGLARWVVAMDDGSRTPGRWLSRGDTGWASATNSLYFQGPGRGAGHSIAALLDGHRLTGDPALLAKAEQLIRRCIHPADDIGRHELLDIERRWSYTIFLHVLGRYLDGKQLRGEIDAAFAYAREALLVYARWMAAHESPYHHRREQLEYPTETWMAQELWKSEVFLFAARYGPDEERDRFVERASYFFDYAIDALTESPTRAMARPLVLLLSRGVMHGYIKRHPEALNSVPPPQPVHAVGRPRRFLPQKALVIKRLKLIAAGGIVAMVLGAAWLLT